MKSITIQRILGSIFLILGLWVLLFPGHAEQTALSPAHYIGTHASAVLIGCFGAQAVLCSILLLTAVFTSRTFLIFGLVGSIPFFIFNYYFLYVVPIFNNWMFLDFIGNIGILLCGIAGWRIERNEEAVAA